MKDAAGGDVGIYPLSCEYEVINALLDKSRFVPITAVEGAASEFDLYKVEPTGTPSWWVKAKTRVC
jgi:hypothetical protein